MIFWTRPKQRQGQFVENDASRVVTKPPRRRADFTVKCHTTMIALRRDSSTTSPSPPPSKVSTYCMAMNPIVDTLDMAT